MVIQVLPREAFYFQNHQEIYNSIIFMHNNKLPIDILTLVMFLQDNGLLEKIGGINVLIELVNQIPNIAYIEEYVGLLKDKFLRRSLRNAEVVFGGAEDLGGGFFGSEKAA